MSIGENESIIIEGIHGLNPKLTAHIDDNKKFRIYIKSIYWRNDVYRRK